MTSQQSTPYGQMSLSASIETLRRAQNGPRAYKMLLLRTLEVRERPVLEQYDNRRPGACERGAIVAAKRMPVQRPKRLSAQSAMGVLNRTTQYRGLVSHRFCGRRLAQISQLGTTTLVPIVCYHASSRKARHTPPLISIVQVKQVAHMNSKQRSSPSIVCLEFPISGRV